MKPLIGVIMGSQSDWETMTHAATTLGKVVSISTPANSSAARPAARIASTATPPQTAVRTAL